MPLGDRCLSPGSALQSMNRISCLETGMLGTEAAPGGNELVAHLNPCTMTGGGGGGAHLITFNPMAKEIS